MVTTRSALAVVLLSLVACGGGGGGGADAAPVDGPPGGGRFTMTWSLAEAGGAALTCDDVAGASVRVVATPINGVAGFVESFQCATGGGQSGLQPPGNYALAVDLRTRDGDSLLAAPVDLPAIELTLGGETAAGDAAFTVDPTGSLSFRVDAGEGTNCGPVDGGNAGITGMTLAVSDGAGACVGGVVLTVGAGGGASGEYTTDCATPPVFGCIESDQVIAIAERRSGAYGLAVTGQKDGVDCYSAADDVLVPGNGLSDDVGTLLLDGPAAVAECDPSLIPDAGTM